MDFFAFFINSDGVFHWNGTSIYVFSNTMNNSAQLKDRELRLFVLFFLIILEMRSSAASECAACVCFLRKLWVWKKVRLKFVKPWEMKTLSWDRENCSHTVWHIVKPWGLGGPLLLYFSFDRELAGQKFVYFLAGSSIISFKRKKQWKSFGLFFW